jgi:hypothetical protein
LIAERFQGSEWGCATVPTVECQILPKWIYWSLDGHNTLPPPSHVIMATDVLAYNEITVGLPRLRWFVLWGLNTFDSEPCKLVVFSYDFALVLIYKYKFKCSL